MSFAATLPAVILETILDRLALLFLTGAGGLAAARLAATQMLAAYRPETANELRLAAEIISFSFHTLEALSQAAANPDMPLTRILRLRGGAVSLSRESHKAQRKLDQLQRDRRTGADPQPDHVPTMEAEPTASRPQIDKALALIEATRQPVQAGDANKTPAPSHQQRQPSHQCQMAQRITENLKKNQALHAASPNAPASAPTGSAHAA